VSRYYYNVPNGPIFGASLKLQNLDGTDVSGVYGDAGIFLVYDDEGAQFPLCTCSKDDVTTIPANSVVFLDETFHTPINPQRNCRIAIDTTSIPDTVVVTAVLLIGAAARGNSDVQVV